MIPVTVLIPVGPRFRFDWLQEAVNSVLAQTYPVDEILLVDDKAELTDQDIHELFDSSVKLRWNNWRDSYKDSCKIMWYTENGISVSIWRSPANIGFAQAFNCGMALASNDLVLYLAADDALAPTAVADCLEAYEANNEKDAWYSLTYQSDEGVSDIPINAAMITRNLWKWMKGYPPSAFAGPDAVLLSCLLAYAPDRIVKVASGKINYRIKMHPNQETKKQFGFFAASGIMEVIRNMETQRFVPDGGVTLK